MVSQVSWRSLRLAISFVCALALFATGSAQAATRYVDNSGSPACSNNASLGTEAQPWCTINYGIAQLRSGDELVVKRGTYNEDVFISGPAGTASANTIIRTYPGHVVTIRGTGNSGRVKITGTSYVTLDGFTVTNFNQGIFVEGASHHVTVQNCTVHDVGQEGIHVKENSSFVTVQGCTVYNTQIAALGGCCNGEGIYVGTSSSGPLDNTNNVTVRNNTIHDVTDEGIEIKPGTYNCIVEGNELYRTNLNVPYAAIELDERDLSPQTWSGNPSHIVRNNLVHDNKNGIRLGTGSTAYNNIVYNTASGFAGILLDNVNSDSFTRFVYHNTIHMTSNAVVVRSVTADIRNNIGPTTSGNIAYSDSLVTDAASHNYHLRAGTAAINTGADLTSVVPTDRDGVSRTTGGRPDLGAYELAQGIPSAPTNVRITP